MDSKVFPKSEYHLRISRAKQLMENANLDAIVATHPKNFEYLTAGWRLGFDPVGYMIDEVAAASRPGFVIVPVDGDPEALIPSLFEFSKERGWVENVRTWHGLPFKPEYLRDQLLRMGFERARIGMEFGEELRLDMPFDDVQNLRGTMPTAEFVSSDVFWKLRIVKSDAEVAKIRTAAEITGKAYERFFTLAKPGMKVKDVVRTLYNCYMDAGALRPSFPPWLGSLDLEERTFREGKVYLFDTAATFDDYTADISRTVVVGRANQQQRQMFEAAVKVNDAVRAASGPGTRTGDLWNICADAMKELRVTRPREPDRIGHGIGLMGNEPPSLAPKNAHVLELGNVHTIEPGIGTRDEYYSIEENVVITETGNEVLTSSVSRSLWEITT